MKKHIICRDCNISLSKNEIALCKKLLGRQIIEFMCISCLADFLSCEVEDLEIKIIEFKEQGCALFV